MKKLLIVAGAGASVEFGMPSVKKIDELFETWALQKVPLKEHSGKSLYSWVKEKMEAYSSSNRNNRMDVLLNFENLLFVIQNISALWRDRDWQNFNNRLLPFANLKPLPEIIDSSGRPKTADGNDFSILHSYLVDNLLDHIRELCKSMPVNYSTQLQLLNNFFKKLQTEFEIGVINLNYDTVILEALPDLKTGFDNTTGKFSRKLLYQQAWNFCYHLHGSIHFDMKGGIETGMHKIFWNNDLNSTFTQNSSGRNLNTTIEGASHLNSTIIAGLDKANQVLREPFSSYFMQLDKLIYESDACLFWGMDFRIII